jgi:3-oxoacyl-(acyl-carrier-protein) synthase
MPAPIVITGIGIITPLGDDPHSVLGRITHGDCAAGVPEDFSTEAFACPLCARVQGFRAQDHIREPKLARLMNRDAQFAVAAARLALEDAQLIVGKTYLPEKIGVYGAAGMAGLPLAEVLPLLRASVSAIGEFDPARFGREGLRTVNPLLSFKILGNMPLCFVSICENLRGPNAIYTPWEGQGARAIEAGVESLLAGDAECALVGGCDVKTHELAFIGLQQEGCFRSWTETGAGPVPGEGAAFLLLETEARANARGARIHARLDSFALRTRRPTDTTADICCALWQGLRLRGPLAAVVTAANGAPALEQAERQAMADHGIRPAVTLAPKKHTGDLFAGAATLQLALAAVLAAHSKGRVLSHCLGHGSEQAAFLVSPP